MQGPNCFFTVAMAALMWRRPVKNGCSSCVFGLDGPGFWAFFATSTRMIKLIPAVTAPPIGPPLCGRSPMPAAYPLIVLPALFLPPQTPRSVFVSKQDLIDAVAEKCDLTKDKAKEAVEAVIHQIGQSMKSGTDIRIPDFGTFKVTKRKAREGRNPLTGKTIQIPAANVPKFTPAKKLKDLLNT
jgi:DNA-binding protein HU-beta